MEARPIIDNVTALAMEAIHAGDSRNTDDPERLRFELDRLQQKKEAVLDHYFSGDISKDDMQSHERSGTKIRSNLIGSGWENQSTAGK